MVLHTGETLHAVHGGPSRRAERIQHETPAPLDWRTGETPVQLDRGGVFALTRRWKSGKMGQFFDRKEVG